METFDKHLAIDVQLTLESEKEFMQTVFYPTIQLAFKKKPFNLSKAIDLLSNNIQKYIRKCYKNEKCRYSHFYGFKPTNWKKEREYIASEMIKSAIDETALNGYIFDEPFNVMEN